MLGEMGGLRLHHSQIYCISDGRHNGLHVIIIVSALDSGLSYLGSIPGLGHLSNELQ